MGVFINYRRADTAGYAGRLYDRLVARYGREGVFMDVDTIAPGEDFVKAIEQQLDACQVMLVLIGAHWLAPGPAETRPRLHDASDFVRIEVETALDRGLLVIPVLVGGAPMPPSGALPDALNSLYRHQALAVGDATFHRDIDKLIQAIGEQCPSLVAPSREPGRGSPAAKAEQSGLLEICRVSEGFSAVVDLRALKDWLRARDPHRLLALKGLGLPSPRGLLLLGMPGCGKGAIVRATAAEWEVPLLRLNLGSVFGMLVGESEPRMAAALEQAQAAAPCILWLDELETVEVGSGRGVPANTVMARVMGHLLTWMGETDGGVFVFATSTDIDCLPPEFTRKGRFDEVFFLDLPSRDNRVAMFQQLLQRHAQAGSRTSLEQHVNATAGFSYSEIETAVTDALYQAFADVGVPTLEDSHIASAIAAITPLSAGPVPLERWRQLVRDGKMRHASGDDERDAPRG